MERLFGITLACIIVLIMITCSANAGNIYVDNNTAPGGNGSQESPFQYIQDGIDLALDGDVVIVADGTYRGVRNRNLDFKGKAITVKSKNNAISTIIDCEIDGRAFYFHSGETSDSIVNGFTIINGYVEYGFPQYQHGGAIACVNSSPIIENNRFVKNRAYDWGGAIACLNDSNPLIEHNIFYNNSSGFNGGAIVCHISSPRIYGNIIRNNNCSLSGGGGILCGTSSSPVIQNNVIAENRATSGNGGGIYCGSGCNPIIINNTISNNSVGGGKQGGAIFCENVSKPLAINNIIWNNKPNEIYIDFVSGIDITYSDINGGWPGEGNINADPLFADTVNSDYHLLNDSPCIGAGIMAPGVPNIDIEGKIRPNPPSMGAYEYQSEEPPPLSPLELTAKPGTTGNTVDLEWTAPQDIGAECDYIVRYNTVPITESNWDISTDVDGEPVPEADTKQSMIVTLPHPGGVYYFVIKTQCQAVTSLISNSPYARSPLQLNSGWNLVSFASLYNSVPIQSAISSIEDKCTSVWTYKDEIWSKYIKTLSWLSDLEYMEPCRGYWLEVSEDCAWDFGNSLDTSPSVIEMRKPPFLLYGKIDSDILSNDEVSVSVKANKFEIGNYVIGSRPNYEDFYALEIPVDDSFKEGDIAQIYIDGLAIGEQIKLGDFGTLRRYDISYHLASSELYQNYPNPCNPETWIPYQLKENGDIVIQIYNIKGDLIRNLKLGYKNAGIYRNKSKAAYWDGKDEAGEHVASGIYFFTIRTGNFTATKKMVVK